MQFDVIIGNPPYQLDDGGTAPVLRRSTSCSSSRPSARPALPVMVIPSRWFAGGKGLDEFRESMLDRRAHAVDRRLSQRVGRLPGRRLKGGVCYFLWDRDNPGRATSPRTSGLARLDGPRRPLLDEFDVFIRFNEAAVDPQEGLRRREEPTLDRASQRRQAVRLWRRTSAYDEQGRRAR